jgi:hypothetical protein
MEAIPLPAIDTPAKGPSRIPRGLRAAPEIDMRTPAAAGLDGLKDPEVLRIAADSGRILVSQDRRTMPGHFTRPPHLARE